MNGADLIAAERARQHAAATRRRARVRHTVVARETRGHYGIEPVTRRFYVVALDPQPQQGRSHVVLDEAADEGVAWAIVRALRKAGE